MRVSSCFCGEWSSIDRCNIRVLEGLANAAERADQISADDVRPMTRGITSSLREEISKLISNLSCASQSCAAGLRVDEVAESVEEELEGR